MKNKHLLAGAFLLLIVLVLASCGGQNPAQTEEAPEATPLVCPTAAPCPSCPECPQPLVQEVPFEEMWSVSAHADAEAEAFVHWNEDDPQEVPANCARCHSTPGYLDYLGEDGTAAGEVNNPAPVGTVITCAACHNQSAINLDAVTFPSGVTLDVEDPSDRCAVCHQGRASMVQVDESIEELGLTEDVDTPNEELGFINIHYYAAAATLYGSAAHGGYEYEGQEYEAKFDHVEGYDSCAGCHNTHSLDLKVDQCQACHQGIGSVEDIRNIRMAGSARDYDGDGDLEEGIYFEIQGLQELLLQNIQAYAQDVAGTPIAYNEAAHPYFFIDTNADGQAGEDESSGDNGYNAWTARLLKAAYNYQTSLKDPGAYAHNGKYVIQLLHDSIVDLNEAVASPVDLSTASRLDAGHFAGSQEAFRHWDEEEGGLVPGTCSKCHTAQGLPVFLANDGATIAQPASSGLNCATCHNDLSTFSRFPVEEVQMPSGAVVALDNPDSNLCLQCHQGRESKVSVDQAIARVGVGDDEVSEDLAFRNPHYFAAGATLFGSEAQGAYQFDDQQYNGRFQHVEPFNTCIECHDSHALTVNAQACSGCHAGVETQEDLLSVRMDTAEPVDYDGDGDTGEGIAGEIQTMHEALFAEIQAYAAAAGNPVQYNDARYPYFFADPNENGEVDEGEGGYTSWTPTLLRAAYNYQWVAKDPGAFAHNADYILQVLYDSLQELGGDVSGMTRPQVQAVEETPTATETPAP